MLHIPYTICRSGTYYYNRRVPRHAVLAYGSFIRHSLSPDPVAAELYSNRLSEVLESSWSVTKVVHAVDITSVIESFKPRSRLLSELAEEYLALRNIIQTPQRVALATFIALTGDRDVRQYFGSLFTLGHKRKVHGVPTRAELDIRPLPNPQKLERYISQAETRRLFAELERSRNPLLRHIVAFLLLTGARKSEALHARWVDFDLDVQAWTIPHKKGGGHRRVMISAAIKPILDTVREIHIARLGKLHELVFPNFKTGEPFVNVYRAWDYARRHAGVPEMRMHDLRHSFASALVNRGVSIYEVENLLGHSSINTTKRYAHLSPERLRESAEVAASVYTASIAATKDVDVPAEPDFLLSLLLGAGIAEQAHNTETKAAPLLQ